VALQVVQVRESHQEKRPPSFLLLMLPAPTQLETAGQLGRGFQPLTCRWGEPRADLHPLPGGIHLQLSPALGAATSVSSPSPPSCAGHLWKLFCNRGWDRLCQTWPGTKPLSL